MGDKKRVEEVDDEGGSRGSEGFKGRKEGDREKSVRVGRKEKKAKSRRGSATSLKSTPGFGY